jgi:hypothetical protein
MGSSPCQSRVVGHLIDLMSQKTVGLIISTIDAVEKEFRVPVGLIIIDTFPKAIAAGGGDEDKARDQGVAYTNLQRIKDLRSVHIGSWATAARTKPEVPEAPMRG